MKFFIRRASDGSVKKIADEIVDSQYARDDAIGVINIESLEEMMKLAGKSKRSIVIEPETSLFGKKNKNTPTIIILDDYYN